MAGERVLLRDGTPARIWPLLRTDRAALVAEFEQLSPESVRRRFLGPVVHLTESMLQHLVDDVDGIDHVALVLLVEQDDSADGMLPVAIGRVVRYPDQDDAADLAVTVKDEWQGRGVASALLPVLIAQRPARVTRLLTEVAADNPASLAMLRGLGPMRTTYDDQGGAEVEVQLEAPAAAADAALLPTDGRQRAWRDRLHTRDLVCPWLRREP